MANKYSILKVAVLAAVGLVYPDCWCRDFTPMMGWSSWNTYRVNISDSIIKDQADAFIELGLDKCGYEFINIDDGFFGVRDSIGVMQSHPQRFPNGMREVTDYIHALGLKAGIYSDAGVVTCGSIFDNDSIGIGAGLYGHEISDFIRYFRDWNFDFIKIDFCGGLDMGLDTRTRYEEITAGIYRIKPNTRINICRWAFPGVWAADIAGSWRISGDISPKWESVKGIIEKNLYLSAYASPGHYNDMDMLEIGRGLTSSQEQVHFAMWCMMSSPLLIGCNLRNIPEASLQLIKNEQLISLNQDVLGQQAYVVKKQGEALALVKDIETENGTKRALAFYNPSSEHCWISVSVSDLDLGDVLECHELLSDEICVIKDSIVEKLPPESVKVWKLMGEKRLERSIYQAVHAYLPLYNDIDDHATLFAYVEKDEDCAAGAKLCNVGGSAENYAQWNHFSPEGGSYLISFQFLDAPPQGSEVWIDEKHYPLHQSGENHLSAYVELPRGKSQIRLVHTHLFLPALDFLQILNQ